MEFVKEFRQYIVFWGGKHKRFAEKQQLWYKSHTVVFLFFVKSYGMSLAI